jgi:hypothetical protein
MDDHADMEEEEEEDDEDEEDDDDEDEDNMSSLGSSRGSGLGSEGEEDEFDLLSGAQSRNISQRNSTESPECASRRSSFRPSRRSSMAPSAKSGRNGKHSDEQPGLEREASRGEASRQGSRRQSLAVHAFSKSPMPLGRMSPGAASVGLGRSPRPPPGLQMIGGGQPSLSRSTTAPWSSGSPRQTICQPTITRGISDNLSNRRMSTLGGPLQPSDYSKAAGVGWAQMPLPEPLPLAFHEFINALIAVVLYNDPNPFVPLVQRFERFIEKALLEPLRQHWQEKSPESELSRVLGNSISEMPSSKQKHQRRGAGNLMLPQNPAAGADSRSASLEPASHAAQQVSTKDST